MEKTELIVTMEPERLDALRYFLSIKEKTTPQKALEKLLEELYETYVPADTRAYLDQKCKGANRRPKPPARSQSAAVKPTPQTGMTDTEVTKHGQP